MARDEKPEQVNLRILSGLRRRLEAAARKNGTSVNNEMRVRLERSLEKDAVRSIDDVAIEIDAVWSRYSERFIALEMEEHILTALENRRYEEARSRALELRAHQAASAEQRRKKMEGKG